MLEMRGTCERCRTALPPESEDTFICAFECTWCRSCAETKLAMACGHCQGELTQRPACRGEALQAHPASRARTYMSESRWRSAIRAVRRARYTTVQGLLGVALPALSMHPRMAYEAMVVYDEDADMSDHQLGAFLSERTAHEVAEYWRYSRGGTVVINYCPIFRNFADWEYNL